MAYVCELSNGQRVYLDNQGTQTIITIISTSLGQQQQSSSGFQTGSWTSPPEMLATPNGIALKITTAQGEHYIQIQGNSISMMSGSPSFGNFQQIQVQQVPNNPMQPMQPMKPMKMGDMQMDINPMGMRMGNMEMRMGSTSSTSSSAASAKPSFCSQCGASVKPSDRFCSSCGHQLSE